MKVRKRIKEYTAQLFVIDGKPLEGFRVIKEDRFMHKDLYRLIQENEPNEDKTEYVVKSGEWVVTDYQGELHGIPIVFLMKYLSQVND